MKKFNPKQILKVVKRMVIAVLVLVLLIVLPQLRIKSDDNLSMIYNTFLGSKSKYQGIIEIWNIDTFESGSASKVSFLNNSAKTFQSKNKGLYIMVRNLSEYECLNLLAMGESPDLFSCSYGVAEKLKNNISTFDKNTKFDTATNFLDAGKMGKDLMAVAWCRGNYCLMTTKSKLDSAEKAGAFANYISENNITLGEGESIAQLAENGKLSLADISLSAGYKVTSHNSTKTIFSIGFGKGKYQLPQNAFEAYTNKGLVSNSDVDIDSETLEQSQYYAYNNFIAGKSTMLLGTQRDIARLEGRVSLGKIDEVIYQPIFAQSDLVQFMLLANINDATKREYAEKFVQYLVSQNVQKKLCDIGMFATTTIDNSGYKSGVMLDIASQNIDNYSVKKLFI